MARQLARRSGLSEEEALRRMQAAGDTGREKPGSLDGRSHAPASAPATAMASGLVHGGTPGAKADQGAARRVAEPAPIREAVPDQAVSNLMQGIERLEQKFDRFLKVDHSELERMQVEIADISGRIKTTKAEIAALRHPRSEEDRLQEASEQLSAVVASTEEATNSIMNSAEGLEDLIAEMKAHTGDSFQQRRLQDMAELVVGIYEACNFQDLTGQRISKVVHALNFIEERVNAMMAAWNEREFESMPLPEAIHRKDGDLNLHGPAKGEDSAAMDQAAIDALFG